MDRSERMRFGLHFRRGRGQRAVCLVALLLAGINAHAEGQDRERAQLMQMQQQIQRMQSEVGSLQRDKAQMQDQLKEFDKVKKELARSSRDFKSSREQASKDLDAAHAEIESLREQGAAQLAEWKKALQQRDDALVEAGAQRRKLEGQVALLGERLKLQTGSADLCESKHEQAMRFGKEVIDTIENERLRLCEPITGIWKVREELAVQGLRERLYKLRLDVPDNSQAKEDAAKAALSPSGSPVSPGAK